MRGKLILKSLVIDGQCMLFKKQVVKSDVDDDKCGIGEVFCRKVDHSTKVGKVTYSHEIAHKGEEPWRGSWHQVSVWVGEQML
jgi:hypothetical protein